MVGPTRSRILLLAVLVAILGLLPMTAGATIYEFGDRLHISALHELDQDLIAWVNNLSVDGTIRGDVIAGAYDFSATGNVSGSMNVFAYQLKMSGRVDGSCRAFCNFGTVDGYVGGALVFISAEPRIDQSAIIEGGADIIGDNVEVDGTIRGDTRIVGDRVRITGTIDGNLDLTTKNAEIYPPAVVTGDIMYSSVDEDVLTVHPGVTVMGETIWTEPEPDEASEEESGISFSEVIFALSKMLAAFLFGIIVFWFFRKYAQSTVQQFQTRFSTTVAIGFLTMFIVVVSALILLVALVFSLAGVIFIQGELAPIGALILILSLLLVPITTFVTVSGGLLFYAGKVMFAAFCGYLIIRLMKKNPASLSKTQLLLGLIALTLLFSIPLLGHILYLLACVIGVGGIVLGIRGCRRENGNGNSAGNDESPTQPTGIAPTMPPNPGPPPMNTDQ